MERTEDELRLDGNAAAGLLEELFAFEVTAAITTCDGCSHVCKLGALALYGATMGTVLRCPRCDHMMMCVTRVGTELRLDLRGVRVLRTPIMVRTGG